MSDLRDAVVEALIDEHDMHAIDADVVAETVMEVVCDWIARGLLRLTPTPNEGEGA